ncbi:MAG: MCE family protein, partial [Gemmatimonadetes bacterium]|nr:MCE family protein [Gemmatimonadota bacterium]
MKRRDELLVGFTILFAMAVVVGGALWLSERQLGQSGQEYVARFNTVGGLSAGSPVVLRGVQVGRVQEIRLAEGNWVEAVLSVYPGVVIQGSPAVIAASASLFGEWQASIVSRDGPDISDPNVLRDLALAAAQGDDAWPGATLPDIGQLTAQAGRIASDIGAFSNRIQTAFNDEAVVHLQSSIRDFG